MQEDLYNRPLPFSLHPTSVTYSLSRPTSLYLDRVELEPLGERTHGHGRRQEVWSHGEHLQNKTKKSSHYMSSAEIVPSVLFPYSFCIHLFLLLDLYFKGIEKFIIVLLSTSGEALYL